MNSYGHLFINKRTSEYSTRCSNGIGTIIDHLITDLLGYLDGFSSGLNRLVLNSTRIITKKVKPSGASWITSEIKGLIKEREKFFKLKNKFIGDQFLASKHKVLSALVALKIKKAKREKCFSCISKHINKPKELWKHLNELIYNRSHTKKTVTCIKVGDILVNEEKAIADHFNDYFTSVTSILAKNFNHPGECDFSYVSYIISYPFELWPTNDYEVEQAILSLNLNAAIGNDNISSKVLQYTVNYISPLLAKFINEAFNSGIFPDCNKTANIIPIYKSGDETDVSNYRPISILTAISKVFEKVILTRVSQFLTSNNIISNHQFGFTLGSNTTSACLNFTDYMSTNIDKKLFCGCLFLDLSKAFDTVNPNILLLKLSKLGFTRNQIKLFETYLSNRRQFVKVNDSVSSEKMANLGVPQGSILGPALFNVYINDITFIKLEGKIQLYADDCLIMYSAESLEELLIKIQNDLQKLKHWLNVNHLSLNHNKSKYIIFTNRKLDEDVLINHPIIYNSFVIERVSKYNYLGLVINSELDWSSQIDKIKKNILPYVFAINRLKYILPRKALLLMYFAFIQSRLTYLNPIWSGAANYKVKELEILQKRVLKNIINVSVRYPTKKLFDEFQSLRFLIERELLILINKIHNNQIKHNFDLIKAQDQHDYNTRRKSNFVVNYFRTKASNNNILYRGLLKYNTLPSELKNITNSTNFKKKITEYLKTYENCELLK